MKYEDIDSVIAEGGSKGIPIYDAILFQDIKGPINTFSSDPTPSDDYWYIQKSSEKIIKYSPEKLTKMVQDDEEAASLMRKYNNRAYWKWGSIGGGIGLIVLGTVIANSQSKKNENGEKKYDSPIGFALVGVGTFGIFVPVTGLWNFIWNNDPLRAIKAYNRNQGSK